MNRRVSAEEDSLLKSNEAEMIIKIAPGAEDTPELVRVKKLQFSTPEEILKELGLLNLHSTFIVLSMGFLWCLSAMPTMSPAYLAPPHSIHNSSYVSLQKEFHLQKTLIDPAELTSSVYFLGNLLLGQIYCMAADRIGRRPVLVWSLIVGGLAGIGSSIAPTFYLMLFGRFIQGSFFNSITMVNWVLCCESIAFKGHSYASVIFGVFWVIGYCIITPIARLFSSWRTLQLLTSLPTFLFGLLMLALLPESFMFLVAKRKTKEAEEWIRRTQRFGGRKFECDVVKTIKNETMKMPQDNTLLETLGHVVHSSKLMLYMTIQTMLWVIDFMIYNALSLSSTDILDGNSDKSFLYSGLVELPCYFLMPVALERLGRRPTVILSHITSAVALIAMCLLSKDYNPTMHMTIWLIAKFGMASAFMCCFVYGAEIFPVQYRNICLGVCATISNIGAMLAPHCTLLDQIFPGFMFIVFAGLCTLGAAITTFLPETKHSH